MSVTHVEDPRKRVVKCVDNGRRVVLEIEEAVRRFRERKFGCVLPLDWARIAGDDGADAYEGPIRGFLSPTPAQTLMLYLMRGRLATTHEEARAQDETLDTVSDSALHRRVKRINDAFAPRVRPLVAWRGPSMAGVVSGYQPAPDFTWLIVLAPADGVDEADIDWQRFFST